MTQQDKEQLKLEIDHIFESGANEIRIFEMVVNFIDSRNGVNKNLRIADVMQCFSDEDFITNVCLSYRHDYGLLGANERNLIRFECKEWLRAIVNNWGNTRTHVFPNVP